MHLINEALFDRYEVTTFFCGFASLSRLFMPLIHSCFCASRLQSSPFLPLFSTLSSLLLLSAFLSLLPFYFLLSSPLPPLSSCAPSFQLSFLLRSSSPLPEPRCLSDLCFSGCIILALSLSSNHVGVKVLLIALSAASLCCGGQRVRGGDGVVSALCTILPLMKRTKTPSIKTAEPLAKGLSCLHAPHTLTPPI